MVLYLLILTGIVLLMMGLWSLWHGQFYLTHTTALRGFAARAIGLVMLLLGGAVIAFAKIGIPRLLGLS